MKKALLTKISLSVILLSLSLSLSVPLEAHASDWSVWEPATVYYDFEHSPGSTYVKDRNGSNDLTLTATSGSSPYIEAGGKEGSRVFFPRGYGQYGVADDSAEFSQTGSFSVEAWVEFIKVSSSDGAIQTVLAKWDETSDDRSYRLIIETDSTGRAFPKFQISTDGTVANIKTVTGKTQIISQKWYLLQGYYDASGTGTIYIYVNGVQEGSTVSVGVSITDEPSNFYLATTKTGSSTYANFINGSIDEVRLLSGTRSEGSFAYSMWRGKPAAKISFDDGSGLQAIDDSPFNNRGALINFPTDNSQWIQGYNNYGLQFDGTDDYVDLGSANSLQLGKAITISAWVYLSSLGDYTIISQPHTNGYTFAITSGGEMTFGALGGTTVTSSGAGVSALDWTHIAVSYNSSGVYFYKDGRVVSSGSLPLWSVATGGVFAGKAGSTPNYFAGKMDNLLIYPYNRTLFEIYLDVNGGAIRLGKLKSLEPANAELACPEGYIWVPGDPLFGTSDFCVMKYEAKYDKTGDGIGDTEGDCYYSSSYDTWDWGKTGGDCPASWTADNVVSTAQGSPIAGITHTQAVDDACPSGTHLITNAEWMTIARDIEEFGTNWCDLNGGGCGFSPGQSSKYLVSGHNDNSPATALQASTDDSQACYGTVTKDVNTACGSSDTQKRTHTLSNGQVIWDFPGNVWEHVRRDEDDTLTDNLPNDGGAGGWRWIEFTDITDYGELSYDIIRPFDSGFDADHRVGRLYTNSDLQSSRVFLRGSYWNNGTDAGAFTLYLTWATSDQGNNVGFRCAR